MSRRGFLGGLGLAGAGVAAGAAAGCSDSEATTGGAPPAAAAVSFHGDHQAGIGTPAQDRLAFAAFDLTTSSRTDLVDLLHTWTAAAVAMTAGQQVPGSSTDAQAPPADTGEAVGLPASALTVTVGFGPTMFDHRFGLGARKPAALTGLPALPGDQLDPTRCGGDLGVQACANDPQVAFHVIRNLSRLASGTASMRWSQLGFGRTSTTSRSQATPRNLMGFKDGTRNIRGEDTAAMNSHVWVGRDSDQSWLRGGSYLVTRRIRMQIEAWDRDYLADQENVFGRKKGDGAPLTGRAETDVPDLAAKDSAGEPVIPVDAHIRLASRETNGGLQILRRGYSYTDGTDPATGDLDAGLFFIAYQKDPASQFVALQRRLGVHDALNEYISHTGSAVFACPPGVRDKNDFWGRSLFA
jgi:deferrochelatase/peroxidase EfeB